MLERQREGIDIAKADGKYKGRKPINEANFCKCKSWSTMAQALAKRFLR